MSDTNVRRVVTYRAERGCIMPAQQDLPETVSVSALKLMNDTMSAYLITFFHTFFSRYNILNTFYTLLFITCIFIVRPYLFILMLKNRKRIYIYILSMFQKHFKEDGKREKREQC